MKKVFLCIYLCALMLVCPMFGHFVYASNIPNIVKTLTQTPIYSDANLLSDFVKDNLGNDVYLQENTTLNVDINFADTKFYKICLYQIVEGKTAEDFGYVLISQTLDANISSPNSKLDTNAKIKNDNSKLYNFQDETYTENGTTLKADTKIRILDGYDKNKEYTYISYQTEDGQIYYSYVKTNDISVEGVNYSVIVAISILIVCASILFIVFGLKGRKKTKKLKKA